MNKLISVIIPVYNVEEYLPKCVESVLSQDYKNLEVILVNDDSPDGCPQICDDFAQADKRVKVIHKPNEKTASARNAGLDIATGEYIAFVDSDDCILQGMYTHMCEFCEEYDLDIGICWAYRNNGDDKLDEYWVKSRPTVLRYPLSGRRELMLAWNIIGRDGAIWNKLYRRELIGDLRFPANIISEDSMFNSDCFSKSKAIGAIDKAYYVYYNRTDSLIKNSNKDKVADYIKSYWSLLNKNIAGIECKDEVLAYSAVRLIAANIFNLKSFGLSVEEYCSFLCNIIDKMNFNPYLKIAEEPKNFSRFISTFGISGSEADNYLELIHSLTQGYDSMVTRQKKYHSEFNQVR